MARSIFKRTFPKSLDFFPDFFILNTKGRPAWRAGLLGQIHPNSEDWNQA